MVIAFVAVVLVTRHVADAQPTGRTRRAGPNSGNSKNLVGRDPDPARMPPGEDKALPAGQAGALGRRADAFDASFKLVDDELLVKFKPGVSKENRGRALGKAKAEERKIAVGLRRSRCHWRRLGAGQSDRQQGRAGRPEGSSR